MPDLKNVVLPEFFKPTKEESYEVAKRLTGDYWLQFSPLRSSPKSTGGYLGGQQFLALRVRGDEWELTQSLCWLCGQGVLTPNELITSLGRKPKLRSKYPAGLEEEVGSSRHPLITQQLIDKVSQYGFDLWPMEDYEKVSKPYDKDLPPYSSMPHVYVIEDELHDVKVGISSQPRWRFRTLERDEDTILKRWSHTKPTRYALTIEQAVLNHFGKGRNPRKRSEEWLWEVTFEDAKAAVEQKFGEYR